MDMYQTSLNTLQANAASTNHNVANPDCPDHHSIIPAQPAQPNQPTSRSTATDPFPGLWSKLSQAFASYTVVFLAFSAWRLFQSRDTAELFAQEAKGRIASDCLVLEKSVSAVASFPHYAAQGVNQAMATSLNAAVVQVGYGLQVVLHGFLATIEFIITFLTGVWRCFLDHLDDADIPLISDIAEEGVQLIDQLTETLVGLLSAPFNELSDVIREGMENSQIKLDVAVPVQPSRKVELCDKAMNLGALDMLARDFRKWITYCAIGVLVVALVVVLFNMVFAAFQHRQTNVHIDRISDQMNSLAGSASSSTALKGAKHEQLLCASRIGYMTQRPLLYRIIERSSLLFCRNDHEKRHAFEWFMHYINQPQVLACLLVGVLGIILVMSQVKLLQYARYHYRPLIGNVMQDISADAFRAVDSTMRQTSATFANEMNTAISTIESDINQNVFGKIVQAAKDMDAALESVQSAMMEGVQSVFGGVFGQLVMAVLTCLLFNKMDAIQVGLRWVQDNAWIELSRVAADVLVMKPDELHTLIESTTAGGSQAPSFSNNSTLAVQGAAQQMGGAVDGMFDRYEVGLRKDLPVYFGLVGVWVVVLVMGLVGARVRLLRQRRSNK